MLSELYSLCVRHSVQLVAWGKRGRFFVSLVCTTEKINLSCFRRLTETVI